MWYLTIFAYRLVCVVGISKTRSTSSFIKKERARSKRCSWYSYLGARADAKKWLVNAVFLYCWSLTECVCRACTPFYFWIDLQPVFAGLIAINIRSKFPCHLKLIQVWPWWQWRKSLMWPTMTLVDARSKLKRCEKCIYQFTIYYSSFWCIFFNENVDILYARDKVWLWR